MLNIILKSVIMAAFVTAFSAIFGLQPLSIVVGMICGVIAK